MKKIPVIIDCDPGHDDMMAIVLAAGSDRLDIKAITTVAGNRDLEKVTQNALNIVHHIGKDNIPVAKGYSNPMVRKYKWCSHYFEGIVDTSNRDEKGNWVGAHGESGLDGYNFPKENPLKPVPNMRSVELIADIVRKSDEKTTLIPVGPLTNIGFFVRLYPELLPKIEKISIMGGTCNFVFTRPFMEFNTFMDPEATKLVFDSGVPIVMHGYDVTYNALYDDSLIEKIARIGNQTSEMVASLLRAFKTMHNGSMTWLDMGEFCPIHDACAVAGVIDPTVIKRSKLMHVSIETKGEYLDGATICDYDTVLDLPKNVEVVFELHNEHFFDMFVQSIKKLK